jgi:hypothetical protein
MPRQAGSCLSSQTLGITVAASLLEQAAPSIHAAGSLLPPPRFVSRCLASSPRRFTKVSRSSLHRGVGPRNTIFGRVVGFMAFCRRFGLFGTLPVSCGWRFAPQCCAWQSVCGRCRVRQLWFCLVVRSAPLAAGVPGLIVRPVLWLATPAMPNPSIERTSPGKPGLASHVKR